MKISTTLLLLLISLPIISFAQIDVIESFFEKEAPEFQINITPTEQQGVVELEIYYTHSRATTLEASFWMVDRGNNRLNQGERSLIGALQILNNRQPITLIVDALKAGNFYGFSMDYRRPSSLINKTFDTKLLYEGYQYQPAAPVAVSEKEMPKMVATPTEFSKKSIEKEAIINCENPRIRLSTKSSGYCQDGSMPALLLENAVDQNWEFVIETRSSFGHWQPIYGAGKRLAAKGAIVRTEPLCLLSDGKHEIRVLAWGENCETPIVKVLREPIFIGASQEVVTEKEVPQQYNFLSKSPKTIPDTCQIIGDATLTGNRISGFIRLANNSPCGTFDPYIMVRYVHPGYRDIALEPIALPAGESVFFDITLDEQDLSRTIHPINVLTYIHEGRQSEDKLMSAFWIRPENRNVQQPMAETRSPILPESVTDNLNTNTPSTTAIVDLSSADESKEISSKTTVDLDTTPKDGTAKIAATQPTPAEITPGKVTAKPLVDNTPVNKDSSYDYEEKYAMTEEAKAVSVTASDPNCTQVHDLQLVYDLQRSQQPLYISWLSPRCCQEGGCEYTIWAGEKPDQLKLMMKGYKAGAKISELLDPSVANANYYEVVVKTSNGTRKAAYVVGDGPKYGFEEILAYHDQFKAPKSDPIMFQEKSEPKATTASFEWEDDELLVSPEEYEYQKPKRAITDFKPCKYKNDINLIAEDPIHVGDEITIQYDYDKEGYRYTLYQRPTGSEKWNVAPGTQASQAKAEFTFRVGNYHKGDYIVALHKGDNGWGCLSAQLKEGLEIEVFE